MKLACELTIGGTQHFSLLTTAIGLDVGNFVITTPGVGQAFWCWATTPTPPTGKRWVACDFTNAPIATSDAPTNDALIAAITTDPATVLVAG